MLNKRLYRPQWTYVVIHAFIKKRTKKHPFAIAKGRYFHFMIYRMAFWHVAGLISLPTQRLEELDPDSADLEIGLRLRSHLHK
jgi:hypothetical protein